MDLEKVPDNLEIYESFIVANNKINNPCYNNIMCAVSGGSDSDIMLRLCTEIDKEGKVQYVFFNTGLEYTATKEHLKHLEEKYGIEIEVVKASKPIPVCCREYGQPFLSKQISEYISRLQRHNFKWEDRPFEELYKEYPNCKIALQWWCNAAGEGSRFNISHKKYLKEFMLLNPPQFRISNKCCHYAKKTVSKRYKKENDIDLCLVGVRRAEGGSRSTAYKNCFTANDDCDEYRPLFWYTNATKECFEEHFDIEHSKCYSEYGLKRTGCAGCPYGRDFEKELEIIREHEPKLYNAVNKIFGDSYEYTRKYVEFVKEQKRLEDELKDSVTH